MAPLSGLLVFLCTAAAVSAQTAHTLISQEVPVLVPAETQQLSHNIEYRVSKDQSKTLGIYSKYDKLLFTAIVDIPKKILQIRKHDIIYPSNSSLSSSAITCIKFLDQLKSGTNAEVNVGSGGIGNVFAIINMKSKRGGPIKYKIEIYGKKL